VRTKRAFPLASFKASDRSAGTFEALVSVFGNVDVVGDKVMPGAFTKSLKAWEDSGDPIPVIWSHDWDNPFAHIGTVTKAAETDEGLLVTGQLDMAQPFAAQVYGLMAERRIREFSFAYDVVDEARTKEANELRELELIEVGPTLKGANPATQLVGVKAMAAALEAQTKKAIASHSTDTSDGSWDGPANEARLSTDAGASTYRKAYAWQDPDTDEDTKAAYRFIHHEIDSDGNVGAANLKACSTGIGVLNGGRGGTTIPDADRKGVYAHLAKHLADGGQEAPELKAKAAPKGHTKAYVTLEGSYEETSAMLWPSLQDWCRDAYGRSSECVLEATYDDRVIVCVMSWGGEGYERAYWEIPYTLGDAGPELGEAREVVVTGAVAPKSRGRKEGRRNSTTDEGRIQNAHDLMVELGATCSGADDESKREEPDGAKRDEIPSPASLRLWAELQELELIAKGTGET
jgi:HK97 family phage prohead protease